MDLLRRQSSVIQLNGKLKAVILIGGPHVGEHVNVTFDLLYKIIMVELQLLIYTLLNNHIVCSVSIYP